MTEGLLDLLYPFLEGTEEHLVFVVLETQVTGRADKGDIECLVEGHDHTAGLADVKVVLLLVFLPRLQFLEDGFKVFTDHIKDRGIGAQVPEIGQPARLVILDPPVFRETLLVQLMQCVAYPNSG